MNTLLYPKLALTNIKKNSKVYIPYIFTCILTVMMHYMMCFLADNKALDTMSGGGMLKMTLALGTGVVGIFSVIFLFYTNSFLVKRRKKEIGLYNILGMEKKHIGIVLALENIYVALTSLVLGLSFGILLSKLLILGIGKLLRFSIAFGFEISVAGISRTLLLFVFIFGLILFYNLFQIHLSNPIELLHGKELGEKEPKTKWLLALFGILCLGGGYYISVSLKTVNEMIIILFFIAVILVIVGTYCIFIAASVAILKILRKNRKYYYKTSHFVNVSGMIYRMKQNAVGLANICILSTMVLVMISSTLSLYLGVEDSLKETFPREIIIGGWEFSEEDVEKLKEEVTKVTKVNSIEQNNATSYRYMELGVKTEGNIFSANKKGEWADSMLYLISLQEYNKAFGETENLKEGEVIVFYGGKEINDSEIFFGTKSYTVKESMNIEKLDLLTAKNMILAHLIVLPDEGDMKEVCKQMGSEWSEEDLTFIYGFNTGMTAEKQIEVYKEIQQIRSNEQGEYNKAFRVDSLEASRSEFLSLYGGLFFLGIFLGSLFLMATVLIMYYKQISEGYDDRIRFEIMQKVGMSKEEIKKAIRSQVLMVFFFPFVVSAIHIAFAFPMITLLLSAFSLSHVSLFTMCTLLSLLVFGVFYIVTYTLTAKVYYEIVNQSN